MKGVLIFFVIVVMLGLIAALFFLSGFGFKKEERGLPPNEDQSQTPKDMMPDFSLRDYSDRSVRSFDFREKLLVINVWASWCTDCSRALKDLAKIQREYKDKISVIAINRAESRDMAKNFTDSLNISNDLILLLDPSDSFYAEIKASAMPETIFISRDGFIDEHFKGLATPDILREKIDNLLAT